MFGAKMTAAAGIVGQQRRLDVIANNVAHVNTVGFRSARVDFKDAIYTAGVTPGSARTPEGNQQRGHGVVIGATTKNFAGGEIQLTGRDLDVAINGDGFFTLSDLSGNISYTRNGVFHISHERGERFLVEANGLYVLDANGERILMPGDAQGIFIDQSGGIRWHDHQMQPETTIAVYSFVNKMGLLASGNGTYTQTPASGERLPSQDMQVVQGALEMSNVNLMEQMTTMIRTQRAFQLASRALTTVDEMDAIANNMRR
ncbi:MAG: flagellar hook-basal body protein [Oscillospiraceae bacterium]|nr:flagellar hook-basal body protein [Oscillospiraceae bacterium]